MKLFVIGSIVNLVLLLFVTVCYGEKVDVMTENNHWNDNVLSEWQHWMYTNGKQYSNSREHMNRFSIWRDNRQKETDKAKRKFRLHHTTQDAAETGLNSFADMTLEEYKTSYLMSEQQKQIPIHQHPERQNTIWIPVPAEGLPDSVDWRESGWVTPVQDQGQYGQSWTFVTTGTVEAQHMNATGNLVKLSDAQLIDCVSSFPSVMSGLDYIEANGSISEDDYSTPKGKCAADGKPITATISSVIQVPEGNEQALQTAVALVGPVAVYVDASHFSFQLYTSGVYYEPDCSQYNLDHTMLVVGYGTEKGEEYWLAKNSWGVNWGESGYIKMARNRNNNCGIATNALYALT